ncbi:hypothetical protein BpHYR1_003671 [Brachionus plicatilis]|uniref:Uncharacterized protein n=1 Tax=Brachionus plicatilis TaxID=10195 RepID=A0A3M7PNG3_BRAPC|nr:hypothetical protein BpHYR1_003671 [Brachionus plicatilis]
MTSCAILFVLLLFGFVLFLNFPLKTHYEKIEWDVEFFLVILIQFNLHVFVYIDYSGFNWEKFD